MNRGSPRRFTDDQIAEIRGWWSARVARITDVTRAQVRQRFNLADSHLSRIARGLTYKVRNG